MATAIRVLHEPQPTSRTHPRDIAAERRLIHLKMVCQFRWRGLLSISDRNEDAELAGLQSGVCQGAVIDRADHATQLAHATAETYGFNALGIHISRIKGHISLYMQAL